MDNEEMKSFLIRDKVFLKRLYNGPNILKNNDILNTANDSELNTLLRFLHFLANGEIEITKENFAEIQKSKKLRLIRLKLEKKGNLIKFLNAKREDKLVFLQKLSSLMPNLLYALFNLK